MSDRPEFRTDIQALRGFAVLLVLSGELSKYLGPAAESEYHAVRVQGGDWAERDPSVRGALEAMRETARRIRALGKRVVLVAPLPSAGFDVGRCLERKYTGRLLLGAYSSCRIPAAEYRHRRPALEFLERLATEAGVNVVSFDRALCDAEYCLAELDGVLLYRDHGHLSYAGSRALAVHTGFGALLEAAAR